MTLIVTTTYRYKRPPRKRKAVALEGAGDRRHEKEPPLNGEAGRRLRLVAQLPRLYVTGQRNPAHRAMRNVTVP